MLLSHAVVRDGGLVVMAGFDVGFTVVGLVVAAPLVVGPAGLGVGFARMAGALLASCLQRLQEAGQAPCTSLSVALEHRYFWVTQCAQLYRLPSVLIQKYLRRDGLCVCVCVCVCVCDEAKRRRADMPMGSRAA